MLTVVADTAETAGSPSVLDEIVREGARRMLAAALEAEVAAYLDAHRGEVDDRPAAGGAQRARRARQVMTGAGAVEVVAPRVNDKRVDEVTGSGSGSPRRSCRRGP